MNLFQKYSPLTLDAIVGHTTIIKELQERTKNNSFPNNLYFSGISGIGKSALSKIIAKTILCQNPSKDNQPCLQCSTCIGIQEDKNLLNFSNYNCSLIGKDEIEIIIENSIKRTSLCENKNKVILLEEFSEIKSSVAEKCILKILERNVKGLYWIITTMLDESTNEAIRNRCVPYHLQKVKSSDISIRLKNICKKENVQLDQEKDRIIDIISNYADGSVRTAFSFLERVLSSSLWEESVLFKELGFVSSDKIDSIINALVKNDVASAIDVELNEKIIKDCAWKLIILFKKLKGVSLPRWQLAQVDSISKITLKQVEVMLEDFGSLLKLPYINPTFIAIQVIKTISNLEKVK